MNNYQHQRRVVCAANQYCGKYLFLGARHHDACMNFAIRESERAGVRITSRNCVQGFIDQHGVFMTREEAWTVAVAANQIIRRVGGDDTGKLFSENLY